MRLTLRPEGVDIWLLHEDQVTDGELIADYRTLLSEDERARECRFVFPEHRRRFVLTRAMIRTVLSRYVRVSPQSWSFVQDAYGRPQIGGPDAAASAELSFNIAHTKGMIVCGIARARRLGIDVERIAAERNLRSIARTCFSAKEAEALGRLRDAELPDEFFMYWTLKEAFIKATGKGLSIPLDQVSFSLPGEGGVAVSFDDALGDAPDEWWFRLFKPSRRHVVALCAGHTDVPLTEPVVRTVVPLMSERVIDCRAFRGSCSSALDAHERIEPCNLA